ncbi:MAG: protein-disulfide reductase DsbD N-terminal domain-containing protein [Usitatibacter sp.]
MASRVWPAIAVLVLLLPAAAAASAQDLLDPDDAFRVSARALDPATIELIYRVAPGYYLYREKFGFEVARPAGAALGKPGFPAGRMKKDPFFGEVEIYRGETRIRLPVSSPPGLDKILLRARSQGCADVGVCYRPHVHELVVPMNGSRIDRPPLPSFLSRP